MSISKIQMGIASALAVAGGAGYMLQAETNASLHREISAVHEQLQTVAALRAENQQLASAAAEIEALRQDDVELKQLEQRVAEIKQASAEAARLASIERARVAQTRARDRWKELQDALREKDQLAQAEVDRMNREGNKLVVEFKALSTQAKDETLTVEARTEAGAAAKAKMEEIKAKQLEVKTFIENTRRALAESPETQSCAVSNSITLRRREKPNSGARRSVVCSNNAPLNVRIDRPTHRRHRVASTLLRDPDFRSTPKT